MGEACPRIRFSASHTMARTNPRVEGALAETIGRRKARRISFPRNNRALAGGLSLGLRSRQRFLDRRPTERDGWLGGGLECAQ